MTASCLRGRGLPLAIGWAGPACPWQCSPFDSAQGERGCDGDEVRLASRETSAQSRRESASFFARLQPLIRRSAARASSRLPKSSEKTNLSGRRPNV